MISEKTITSSESSTDIMNEEYSIHKYFLKVLARKKRALKSLNKKKIIIPHTLFMASKTIWYWFFNEKNIFRTIEHRFLNFSVIFSFFCVKGARTTNTLKFNEYEILLDLAEKGDIKDYHFMIKMQVRSKRKLSQTEKFDLAEKKRIQAGIILPGSKKTLKRFQELHTIGEEEDPMLFHDSYIDYQIDYFYIVNRKTLEHIQRSDYSTKLKCIYSNDLNFKKKLFYRVKIFYDENPLLRKYEILRVAGKGDILNVKKFNKILEEDQFHLGSIHEFSYFTKSRDHETNMKLKEFMMNLVKYFDRCSYEKILELGVYAMKPLMNSEITLLEVIDLKVKIDRKIIDVNVDNIYDFLKKNRKINRLSKISKQAQIKLEDHSKKKIRKSIFFNVDYDQEHHENNKICKGLYCNQRARIKASMIDEKDDKNNFYIDKKNLHKIYKIEFKSIILDYVEHVKTVQRVKSVLYWPDEKIESMNDGLLLKFRKFYTLFNLRRSPLFDRLRYIHLYQEQTICAVCYSFYRKIDDMRASNIKFLNPYATNPLKIPAEISRYGAEEGSVFVVKGSMKKLFSKEFRVNLRFFDEEEESQSELELDESLLEPIERKIVRRVKRKRNMSRYYKEKKRLNSLPKMKKDTFYNLKAAKDKWVFIQGNVKEKKKSSSFSSKISKMKKEGFRDIRSRAKNKKHSMFGTLQQIRKKRYEHILKILDHQPVNLRSKSLQANSISSASRNKNESETLKYKTEAVKQKIFGNFKKKLKILNLKDIENMSMRLHLGKDRKMGLPKGDITTKASLQLSKLEKKILKLGKVVERNRNGNLGMERKKFLELIMCEYKGKRQTLKKMNFDINSINPFSAPNKEKKRPSKEILEKSRMKKYMRERRDFQRMHDIEESSYSMLGSSEDMDIVFEPPLFQTPSELKQRKNIKRSTTVEYEAMKKDMIRRDSSMLLNSSFIEDRERRKSRSRMKKKGEIFSIIVSYLDVSAVGENDIESGREESRRMKHLKERIRFENSLLTRNKALPKSVLESVRKSKEVSVGDDSQETEF